VVRALIGKNKKKYSLLAEMQKAHDDSVDDQYKGFLSGFESRMEKIAASFGLTYKAPGASLRT
jgi:hypothetical protein